MPETWPEIVAKAVVYWAVMGSVGTAGLRWLLLPQIRAITSDQTWASCQLETDRTLERFAGLLLLGLILREWTHTIAVFGLTDALSWQNIALIGFESRWAQGWRVQVAAAAALFALTLLTRAQPSLGRLLSTVAAVLVCGVLPLTGHAAGHPWRVATHGAHVLAAGFWLGTLVVVVTGPSPIMRVLRPRLLRAFAPIAMTGAAVLIGSGALSTFTYLGSLPNLWTTEYGRLLSVKLLLVCGILVFGGLNWRWLHHRRADDAHARYLLFEVILAASVVLVTAWLTEVAHPSG
jgi:putative copper export protein